MPIPVWALGLALSAASSQIQNNATNRASEERSAALRQERMRQDALRKEQQLAASKSINNFSADSVGSQTENEKGLILDDLVQSTNIEPVGLGISPSRRDNSLVDTLGRQDAKRASDKKIALAGLLSSGGALRKLSEKNRFNAADISRLAGFSGGSHNVNAYELDYAKMLANSGLADLTGALGRAALLSSASQPSPSESNGNVIR